MCGDNRYDDDLRTLTTIELYLNSGFYSEHPAFVSLISKYSKVLRSVDTTLAISVLVLRQLSPKPKTNPNPNPTPNRGAIFQIPSVSPNALDSNKTKEVLNQNKVISMFFLLSGLDFHVSLVLHPFVQVQFNVIIETLVHY